MSECSASDSTAIHLRCSWRCMNILKDPSASRDRQMCPTCTSAVSGFCWRRPGKSHEDPCRSSHHVVCLFIRIEQSNHASSTSENSSKESLAFWAQLFDKILKNLESPLHRHTASRSIDGVSKFRILVGKVNDLVTLRSSTYFLKIVRIEPITNVQK